MRFVDDRRGETPTESPLGNMAWFSGLGLSQSEFMADPYRFYRQWRQRGPRQQIADDHWMLLDYSDVRRVFSEAAFVKPPAFREAPPPEFGGLPDLEPSMLMSNPPDHTRLRGLVSQAFQPRHLVRLKPFIESLADSLTDSLVAVGGGDLVGHFAFPLPALVIAELLGVPRTDQDRFRDWSHDVARLLDASQPEAVRRRSVRARWELLEYFQHLIDRKRAQPGEDLLTELVRAETAGDKLSAGELLSMALVLLVAGHETTTNLLSMGTLGLIEQEVPVDSIEDWGVAVEELLRFTSPVQLDARMTAQTVTFGEDRMPAGAFVTIAVGAANRDPAVFAEPDRLNVTREPNPHLAFGRGIHFCLGAALARLEATIAFPRLLRHRWQVSGMPVWNSNLVLRGLGALPVSLR